jgi:hypothetical protein
VPADLANLDIATGQAIAAKMDSGQLSREEGIQQIAQMEAQITSEAQRRGAQRAATTAAIMSAIMSAMPRYTQPQAWQPYQPPINTTCSRMGAFTNCTSQ